MKNRLTQPAATGCNTDTPRRLTPVQMQAAALLAAGGSDDAVASTLGLNRSTVWRWRTGSPTFQAELNHSREAINGQLADALRDAVLKALTTLGNLLSSTDEATQLRAAVALLAKVPLGIDAGPTDPRAVVRPAVETQYRAAIAYDLERRVEAELVHRDTDALTDDADGV